MKLKDNLILIRMIIDHLEEKSIDKNMLIQELSKYKEFIEEKRCCRAILIPYSYEDLDSSESIQADISSIKKGDSFSYSFDGLSYFLEGQKDRDFSSDEVMVDIFSADVVGINLKKVILYLREHCLIDEFLSGIHEEDEILAINITNVKLEFKENLICILDYPEYLQKIFK